MTQLDSTSTSPQAGRPGLRLIRWLVAINLGLVVLQPVSAGFFLSGYGRATTIHAAVAVALQLGALIQAITAIVLWRRRLVPASVAGVSIGLFVMVFLQAGVGYSKRHWLHVPLGVGILGWLTRQRDGLDTLWRGGAAGRHP